LLANLASDLLVLVGSSEYPVELLLVFLDCIEHLVTTFKILNVASSLVLLFFIFMLVASFLGLNQSGLSLASTQSHKFWPLLLDML